MVAIRVLAVTVLPASAGMIRLSRMNQPLRPSAPRICGDDPEYVQLFLSSAECSPHLRG